MKINLTMSVDVSPEEAMHVATKIVSGLPGVVESFRLTVQGDLYDVGVGSPRHRKGVRRPEKARAVRDGDYAVSRTR